MNPIRFENDVAVFTLDQIDMYGEPDYYGWNNYIVLDSCEPKYVYDYHMELDRKMRPIHRYNRVERFRFVLGQLLGAKGDVPRNVLDLVKHSGAETWQDIRHVLKTNGLRKFYNRIPSICNILNLPSPIQINWNNILFHQMVNQFLLVQDSYLKRQTQLDRKYFPSIRYIALKILEQNGAVFKDIVFIRTRRKQKALDELWELIKNNSN